MLVLEVLIKQEEGADDLLRDTPGRMIHMIGVLPLDMNISENQVLPMHNLSKGFRPNLAMIQVSLFGTKFIPKWYFEKRNNAFKYFNVFIIRMNNTVFFTETKPGVFERNARFKLKSNFETNIQ